MRTTSLMLLGTMASAQHFQIHIESRPMNPEEQKEVSALLGKVHERFEEMEGEMEANMQADHHLRGPPPFLANFFGPPPSEHDEMGSDMPKLDNDFHGHHGFFGEHDRHHDQDHHRDDHGLFGKLFGHHDQDHHRDDHGLFGKLFGPPPPPPREDEDEETRPPPPFFAQLFGPPPPRPNDEEFEEHEGHHGPRHGMRQVEMMCHEDRVKFCSENHHPFFITSCLLKHAKDISKECEEVLPKHPLRCVMMHLLMTCLMMYICIRVVRLAFRYVRSNEQFNQYPGNIVIAAQEVPVNNEIHMGKVVPVELMPPVESEVASV